MFVGATLAGRVLNVDGQPAEGAVVEAKSAAKKAPAALRATTDAKGEFFLRVPLGDYLLTAQTETLFSPTPLPLHVITDVTADACIIRMEPRPAGALRR
jgi:Carboxypeptidase regulatory-like domain